MPAAEQIRFLPFGGDEPEIGQGFNTISGEFVGTALNVGSIGVNPVAIGGVSAAQAIAHSHSELLDMVGGCFSLSARYGLASGSAKSGEAPPGDRGRKRFLRSSWSASHAEYTSRYRAE